MASTINCFLAPCEPPTLPSSSYDTRSLYQLPPILSQAPSYTPGIGQALPSSSPTFTTSTNELDRYRVLFLILGIVIGAMFLSQR